MATTTTTTQSTRYIAAGAALLARYMGTGYRYGYGEALRYARRTLERAEAQGWLDGCIAVTLGEAAPCSNCGRPATCRPYMGRLSRCAGCEHLPSDYDA